MKVFICLLATLGVCNASFLSFLGGGGAGGGTKTTYNVIATPQNGGGSGAAHGGAHGHGQVSAHGVGSGGGGGGSAQIIKVILEEGQGYSNVGAHSYVHGHDSSHDHGSYGEQVYKVIKYAAPVAPSYSYGQSYASGHGDASSTSYHSQQINAILPQIIQLVLQEDALYGAEGGGRSVGGGYGNVDAINGQLIDTFGHKGKAIVMRADKAQGAFFQSGHVVQRGTLKVMRVHDNQQQQQVGGGWSSGGASNGGWSSGGASNGGWSNGGASSGGWSSGGASSGGWSNAQPSGW